MHIGRVAARTCKRDRAGAAGIAIAFCDPAENAYLRDIERLTRTTLTVVQGKQAPDAPKQQRDYARKTPFHAKRGRQNNSGKRRAA